MKIFFISLYCLFFICSLQASNEQEKSYGYFIERPGETRIHMLSRFLSYKPVILVLSQDPTVSQHLCKLYPNGTILQCITPYSLPIEFLWLDWKTLEFSFLNFYGDSFPHLRMIYTSIEPNQFSTINTLLTDKGFTCVSHWYKESGEGYAFFLKNDYFQTLLQTLNYSISNRGPFITCHPQHNLTKHFQQASNKTERNKYESIDFIYMINLDERPEKFLNTSQILAPYGIFPYRFSAVNGWKLPHQVFEEIGLKLATNLSSERFMGTVFREDNSVEYLSNEYIQEPGTTYFSYGMTRGAVGITLSHLSILQDAYHSNYKTIWVMEDDVEVVQDPRQLPALIQELDQLDPDWDILFTDKDTKDKQGNYILCRALAARPNYCMPDFQVFMNRFYSLNDHFNRIGMRYGAYSMIIRRSGMKKILNHFKTHSVFLPYDMDFWLDTSLRMYCLNFDVVSTIPDALSDNSEPMYDEV